MGVRLYCWHLGIAIASAITLYTNTASAQITPDATLPNNSNVTLEDKTFNITGGSTAGGNLFHSFQDFSIPTGSGATFNNAVEIQNIISRVTGQSISNIDGLIKANGGANLFLINPNGIIFGQNARLDIGGSFLATSANSIKFGDGFEFSAVNTESQPLLTVTAPVGLQFGEREGSIQVQGNGEGVRTSDSPIIDIQNALRVQPGKTLALVGGDINLEGATLKTAGGRIELGSVASNGLVSLIPNNKGFSLGYNDVLLYGNIQLSQQAIVDASGEGAGDIQVQGRRVNVTLGSGIQINTVGDKQGGDLIVNATESLEVSRFSAFEAIVYSEATGNAGNLTINTRELLIRDGASVGAGTFGEGNGGNLTVIADSIQVIGRPGDGRFDSYLTTQTEGTGNAGNLTINTRELLVQNGAQVGAATLGGGNGGNLAVTADTIQVIGGSSFGRRSNLAAPSEGTGNAGNLTINTRELLVQNEAFVSVSTLGVGNAGNLTINTSELLVQDGANVAAGTLGRGKGGNLAINARSVRVIGISPSDNRFFSLLTAQTRGAGNGGNLTINTSELLVQDGARINVQSSGTGTAGNLTISANSINLAENALLNANTRSNRTDLTQATININSQDLILRRNSRITTNAAGSLVIGGDININTQVLGAFENSKITANSANFRGGNINIKTQGLFRSPDSAITASGATSALSGNVLITTLTDPSRGLVEIPINLVDASNQISNACIPGNLGFENTFTVTGRGGLPISPTEPLQDQRTYSAWVKFKGEQESNTVRINKPNLIATSAPTIIEASSWIADKSGNIELVAPASQTPQTPHSASCSELK